MFKKLIFAGLFTSILSAAGAQNYQLHSVFMYSFAKYIQWPDDASQGEFSIMVYGDSPILQELNTLAGKKKIGDRPIQVVQINSLSDVRKCNILFVPGAKSGQLAEILGKLGDTPTLVVTEQSGAKGSSINFTQKEGKLAFELNSNALSKRKLRPASELTRLAIII